MDDPFANDPPLKLLVELRQAGFGIRAESGALLLKPVSKLTVEQRQAIATHREALVEMLSQGPEDEVIDAIAERAWLDEPIWSDRKYGDVVRESVIVRLEGFPTKAFHPEEIAALDVILEGVRATRAARAAKDEARVEKSKRPRQRTMEATLETQEGGVA